MKIIAKGSSKFIVEADEYEIANIMGYQYPSSLPSGSKIDVGREVQVSKLWAALTIERTRVDEIRAQASALRKTADRLDSINAALDCPIVEP